MLFVGSLMIIVGLIPTTSSAGGYCNYSQNIVSYQPYYAQRIVAVPFSQNYVAIPANPYTYVWGGIPAAVPAANITATGKANVTAGNAASNNDSLTKKEFILAMKELTEAIRSGQGGGPSPINGPQDAAAYSIITTHCATCHTAPNGKKGVNLINENGQVNEDEINWDRVAILTLTHKMPKGGDPLSQEDVNALVQKSLRTKAGIYAPPAAGNSAAPAANTTSPKPNPDANY